MTGGSSVRCCSWLVFTCTEDSAHSIPPTRTVHSHWHLEAEHEASIYTQEISKCHVSGLLKIQHFLRAGLHPTAIVNTSVFIHFWRNCTRCRLIEATPPWAQRGFIFQNDFEFICWKLDLNFNHLFS